MSSAAKILIGVIIGTMSLCLLAGAAGVWMFRSAGTAIGRGLQSDQERVSKVSASIAGYDLPGGFSSAYAMQAGGFDLLSYTGQDGHSHVYFFQLPGGVRVEQDLLERQFNQNIQDQGNDNRRTVPVSQTAATVRGQETTLVVSEGVNSEGQAFRQATAMFEGVGGQALVVFERPVSSWDQAEMEAFIASIR